MGRESYLPLFFGDFLASTYTWDGEEQGLYLLLLGYQWTSGPLPTDLTRLSRAVRIEHKRFLKLWGTVSGKFTDNGNGLVNERLEEHRTHSLELGERRSKAGQKGAEMRWQEDGKGNGKRIANASDCHTDAISKSNSIHPIHPSNTSLREVVTPPGLDADAWERWQAYRKALKKPIRPVSTEAAMRALAAYGGDQAAVVEQSIANGYQGLVPLKQPGFAGKPPADGGGRRIPTAEQRADGHLKALQNSARAHGIDPSGLSESQINNAIFEAKNRTKLGGVTA